MEPIRISIVEDDPEFQQWLVDELGDAAHFQCISRYDLAENALANIPNERPDIVIMDLGLDKSDIDGIECMLRLKLVSPQLKFLVITGQPDDDKVFEALKVGAGAYIQKGDIPKKLIDLLEEFHQGGAPMSAGIARKVIASFYKAPTDILLIQQLTPKEVKILELLAKGYLFKEIADMIPNDNDPTKKIAEGTVKIHAHNIYKKLQVNNRVEAINKYLNRH
ncbi:MAG TPA: response regulator transcription factor [Saprospiraceae bacterium]|nr:response regulator transcription factor [Saprospiraceae bacterium]HND88916.1 response regulator transcription factor [Saprospiraceae bacterium]